MIAQAHSATLIGIEAIPIVFEVDLQGYIQGDADRAFFSSDFPTKRCK